jgi:hypothetical protein
VYYPNLKKYLDVYKKVLSQLTPEQKDLAATLTTQIIPQKYVERETPGIVKALQQKGVKTMALTSSLAGEISGFPKKMIILRRDQLQRMGIDFTNTFKDFSKAITFTDFKKYAGGYPMFYHGILSTNGEGDAPGDILIAFLTHIGSNMKHKAYKFAITEGRLLIDDKRKHLENVETALKIYDPAIQFIGIEYEGAYNYAPQDISKEDFQKFWEDVVNKAG